MAPEVFFSVCYGSIERHQAAHDMHTFTSAILDGFCRRRVSQQDYPAIIREEGHSVRGVYATGLTDANIFKLDIFEGSEYERVKVNVRLLKQDGEKEVEGEEKATWVYVYLHRKELESGEWDFEEFRKEKMAKWTRGDWAFDQGTCSRRVELGLPLIRCRPRGQGCG